MSDIPYHCPFCQMSLTAHQQPIDIYYLLYCNPCRTQVTLENTSLGLQIISLKYYVTLTPDAPFKDHYTHYIFVSFQAQTTSLHESGTGKELVCLKKLYTNCSPAHMRQLATRLANLKAFL